MNGKTSFPAGSVVQIAETLNASWAHAEKQIEDIVDGIDEGLQDTKQMSSASSSSCSAQWVVEVKKSQTNTAIFD